ncbi:hypothetical protein V6N12_013758 [Hibiscus sabdariffa]|uniref:RNase H type-1 domain-containing protein n=1 Tax=Hibiscus sabdariffa TaxID=183260 RepID=A0ABR2CV58_9ROSI
MDVVRSIQGDNYRLHSSALVAAVAKLLRRSWEVRVCHVNRCGNVIADNLAKLATSVSDGFIFFPDPPQSIYQALHADASSD